MIITTNLQYSIRSLVKSIMPRAARRKGEKELVETAKRIQKLTSFFGTAPTKEVVEPDLIDSESVLPFPPTTETPPTFLSHNSDSE